MEEFLGVRYRLETSENLDDYLIFMDVGYFQRLTGKTLSPVSCLIKNEDGTYSFTMEVEFLRQSATITFRSGEEFVEERADKVKVKATVVIEGNKMIHTQVEDNGRTSKHERVFTADTLVVTTTAIGWDGECIRTYRRVPDETIESIDTTNIITY